MDELRQLLRRFIGGEVAYREFRREFGRFFAMADAEPSIAGDVCVLIESECSAFEHGIIDLDGLKIGLSVQVAWAGAVPRTVSSEVTITFNPQQQEQTVMSGSPAANSVMTVLSEPIAA